MTLMTMPQVVIRAVDLTNKVNNSTLGTSNTSGFWNAFVLDQTAHSWDTVVLSPNIDTTQQEITDISGKGVLTQVIGSALTAAGTNTIIVTIDDTTTYTFTSETTAADDPRFCIGDIRIFEGTTSANYAGVGGRTDQGYGLLSKGFIPIPPQTIVDRDIGIPFSTRCVITQQTSVNPEASHTGKAGVAYTTYIPRGLE